MTTESLFTLQTPVPLLLQKIKVKKSVPYNKKILLQTHLHSPKSENIYQDNSGNLKYVYCRYKNMCSDFKTFHYMGFIYNDVM